MVRNGKAGPPGGRVTLPCEMGSSSPGGGSRREASTLEDANPNSKCIMSDKLSRLSLEAERRTTPCTRNRQHSITFMHILLLALSSLARAIRDPSRQRSTKGTPSISGREL